MEIVGKKSMPTQWRKRSRSPDIDLLHQSHSKRRKSIDVSIPNDALFEILLRVPASSILRWRVVGKWFNSITRDFAFKNLHLEHALGDNSAPLRVILLSCDDCDNEHQLVSLDESLTPAVIGNLRAAGKGTWMLTPSCNGLVCIYDELEQVQLLNPTTRELFSLPAATKSVGHQIAHCHLGFDPSTKEYKVVRIFAGDYGADYQCEVFTLGTKAWRQICSLDRHPLHDIRAITIAGVVYWIMISDSDDITIESFNLEEEKFNPSIPLPDMAGIAGMFEHEGRLCMALSYQEVGCYSFDVRMLNDKAEYVRLYSWSVPSDSMSTENEDSTVPMFVDERKIFVRSDDEIHYFDIGKHLVQKVPNLRYAEVYVESLVSPGASKLD